MDVIHPQELAPSVLLLGRGNAGARSAVEELCRQAGFSMDHAVSRAKALELFLERGGHEILICHGEMEGGMRATVMALSDIRSDLACFVLAEDSAELVELREAVLLGGTPNSG